MAAFVGIVTQNILGTSVGWVVDAIGVEVFLAVVIVMLLLFTFRRSAITRVSKVLMQGANWFLAAFGGVGFGICYNSLVSDFAVGLVETIVVFGTFVGITKVQFWAKRQQKPGIPSKP